MRKNIILTAALAAILSMVACSPIEDQSLRDKYIKNAGELLTSYELSSHLTVSQDPANDDVIYVVNDDPSLGVVWHFTTAAGDQILKSDKGSYTYTANGDFEVFAVAPAGAGKSVESEHFKITVTNVYDPWVGMLTGAKNKSDKSAVKTWGFRPVDDSGKDIDSPEGYICAMSAYGFWKWYAHTTVPGQAWWGQTRFKDAGDQTMKFTYAGAKLETFAADGTKTGEGAFAVDHTPYDNSPANTGAGAPQMGKFTSTIPVIGNEFNDYGSSSGLQNFMLIYLDDNYMTLAAYPDLSACSSSLDWNEAVWISYYKAK